MLNQITVMGRMVRDPELRRIPAGVAVASFTVAVDRDMVNKETGLDPYRFHDLVKLLKMCDKEVWK